MVLLKPLIFLLFLFLSLGELVRISVFNGISVGPIEIVLVILVGIWALKYRSKKYELTRPIVFFTAIGAFSLLVNLKNFSVSQIEISSLYLFRWLFYALIYFIFRDIYPKHKKQIDRSILFSGLMVLGIGLIQFFSYPSLRNLYYLGWDEHLYRLFSSYLDPNFTGVILVLFFVFVFIKRKEFFRNKVWSYIILILTFLAIVLTYSRGALLMFAICALTYSILQRSWKVIGLTLIVFIGLFAVLSPRFYLENTNLLRTVSTKERLATAQKAFQIWQKNPIGVGFDTYRYAREKYGDRDTSKFGPSHSGAGVDNSLILVLVTTGIEGLIAYAFLVWKMFKLGLKDKKNLYGRILVISIAGLLVNSMTINSLFYSFIMIWMWILAGITESNSRG